MKQINLPELSYGAFIENKKHSIGKYSFKIPLRVLKELHDHTKLYEVENIADLRANYELLSAASPYPAEYATHMKKFGFIFQNVCLHDLKFGRAVCGMMDELDHLALIYQLQPDPQTINFNDISLNNVFIDVKNVFSSTHLKYSLIILRDSRGEIIPGVIKYESDPESSDDVRRKTSLETVLSSSGKARFNIRAEAMSTSYVDYLGVTRKREILLNMSLIERTDRDDKAVDINLPEDENVTPYPKDTTLILPRL